MSHKNLSWFSWEYSYVCIYIYIHDSSGFGDNAPRRGIVHAVGDRYRRNTTRTARTMTFCLEVSSPALSPPHIQHHLQQKQRPALFALSQIVLNYNEVLSPQPPQSHPSKSLLEIPHMGFADCEKKSSSQEAAQLLRESACLGVLKFSLVCFLGLFVLVFFSFFQLLWMCVCQIWQGCLTMMELTQWHQKWFQTRERNQCAEKWDYGSTSPLVQTQDECNSRSMVDWISNLPKEISK